MYSDEFTWREPWETPYHLLGDWVEGETPLPPNSILTSQSDVCIPLAIYTVLTAQMWILAKNHGMGPPPALSWQHLWDIFHDHPRGRRHISEVLHYLHYEGIVAEGNYGRLNHPETVRYKVNYHSGFLSSGAGSMGTLHDWTEWVETQLLRDGPLVAEIKVREDYGYGRELLYTGVDENLETQGVNRLLGHAIALTGWGMSSIRHYRNTQVWEYQNSYGAEFGRDGGFGEAVKDKLYFVYGACMRPWW